MLTLFTSNRARHEVPYEPDFPMWRYLAEVIAPAMGLRVVDDGKTVFLVCVAWRGSQRTMFSFENKLRLMRDVAEDGGIISVMPSTRLTARLRGNACPDGGDASGCAICLEPTYDFSLACLHRFHCRCLRATFFAGQMSCPTCRSPVGLRDFILCRGQAETLDLQEGVQAPSILFFEEVSSSNEERHR